MISDNILINSTDVSLKLPIFQFINLQSKGFSRLLLGLFAVTYISCLTYLVRAEYDFQAFYATWRAV